MSNSAKKVQSTGANNKLQPMWIPYYKDDEAQACKVFTKKPIDLIDLRIKLWKDEKPVEFFGLTLDYSKVESLDINYPTKKWNINTLLLKPLVSQKDLESVKDQMSLKEWKQLVFLAYGVIYYSDPKLLKYKVKGARKVINTAGKKLRSEAKKLALSMKGNSMPKSNIKKISNKTVLSSSTFIKNEKRLLVLTHNAESFKPSKKHLNSSTSKANRNKTRRHLEKIELNRISKENRELSLSIQANSFTDKSDKEPIFTVQRIRKDTYNHIKGGKEKDLFAKTKYLAKSKHRNHLNISSEYNRDIKHGVEKWFNSKQEAIAFVKSTKSYTHSKYIKSIFDETPEQIGEEFCIIYKLKRNKHYKATTKRDKKSMNYVVPSTRVNSKQKKTHDSNNTLVCITDGTKVYRITRAKAETALLQLKGFTYTTKAKWKESKLNNNDSYSINLDIRTPKVRYEERVKANVKLQNNYNNVRENRIERKNNRRGSNKIRSYFKNEILNSRITTPVIKLSAPGIAA